MSLSAKRFLQGGHLTKSCLHTEHILAFIRLRQSEQVLWPFWQVKISFGEVMGSKQIGQLRSSEVESIDVSLRLSCSVNSKTWNDHFV